MADVTNILHPTEELNDDQLMRYLQGNLSDEQRNAIEQQMVTDDFTNDAVEGLEIVGNKAHLHTYIDKLNHQLQKSIAAKKQRKAKRKLADNSWIIIAISIILVLCVIGYYVLHLKLFS
ncbi:MAG: hypothetical protein H7101_01795 [Deinococcales bacterium]|nr:hypothetical protein [Chitinophagaceae bacterium]